VRIGGGRALGGHRLGGLPRFRTGPRAVGEKLTELDSGRCFAQNAVVPQGRSVGEWRAQSRQQDE